jgi:adenylate cyclase
LLKRSRESLLEAQRLLRRAIEIDPGYAPAMASLASCCWTMVSQNWMDRANPAGQEMIGLAQAALALDGNDPEVLRQASWIIALPGGDLSGGIALVNKAIDLDPNSVAARERAGELYAYAGDKQSAIAQLERSVRLNPINRTLSFYFAYALAHFVASEHEATVEWTGKALQVVPNHAASLRYRAASLGLLGRLEEGRQVVQRLLELVPDFTIARARRHIEFDMNHIFKTPGVADSLYEGLRRSGVPE